MKLDWMAAYSVERELAVILAEQEQYGWLLDIDKANELVGFICAEEQRLTDIILPALPKVITKGTELNAIFKKDRSYTHHAINWISSIEYESSINSRCRVSIDNSCLAGSFTRVVFNEPNLNSQDQIKKALYSLGWEPDTWNYKKDTKTKKFMRDDKGEFIKTSPKITESSLESITTEHGWGKDLVQLLKIQARKKFFVGGNYNEDDDEVEKGLLSHIRADNTVPSEVIQCGTNTGRATHVKVANVPRPGSFLGEETRSLFIARPGRLIVGTDYKALESYLMADAIYKYTKYKYGKGDQRFLDIILSVEDLHTYLWDDLRDYVSSRSLVKNINYAFPYGAQEAKLGTLCDLKPSNWSNEKMGKLILEVMKDKFPGLVETRDATVEQAKCGWLPGLDGRKIYVRSAHSAFNAKIQEWGAEVVKMGIILKTKYVKENGLDSHQVGWYHDEWQDEVVEGQEEDNKILSLQAVSDSGTFYNLSCPMVAESKVGRSWNETH